MTQNKPSVAKPFDKYDFYIRSVQAPENDAKFIYDTYAELRSKKATLMREDFCGTFNLTCEWVKLSKDNRGIGMDLDPEPIEYGHENYLPDLNDEQQSRVSILKENVLSDKAPKADIVNAMNFSYFIFKNREELKAYFQKVYDTLNDDGMFIVDCFGGSECQEANENETEYDDYSYFWDQDSFDPVTNEAMFYIHFKRNGEKKREQVFTYDWRMWSIPELRDIMAEVGFKDSVIYWEGTDDEGDGNGEFVRTEVGEECESWIAYVAGLK